MERSGGFAPLRHVPAGKTVVLGLVSTKLGQMESKDDLKRRIEEAATCMPLGQMGSLRSAGSPAPFTEMTLQSRLRRIN